MTLLSGFPAAAAQAPAATRPAQPEQVIIQGQRPDDYKIEVPNLSRLTEPLLDTLSPSRSSPIRCCRIAEVSNLNDALRNVPSISLGAGEFSFQGNTPTIRGFVARTDMFLDGIRNFGNYYRGSFNLQQIEVWRARPRSCSGAGPPGTTSIRSASFPLSIASCRGP